MMLELLVACCACKLRKRGILICLTDSYLSRTGAHAISETFTDRHLHTVSKWIGSAASGDLPQTELSRLTNIDAVLEVGLRVVDVDNGGKSVDNL